MDEYRDIDGLWHVTSWRDEERTIPGAMYLVEPATDYYDRHPQPAMVTPESAEERIRRIAREEIALGRSR